MKHRHLGPFVSSPQTLPVSVWEKSSKEKAMGMFLLEMNFGSFSQDLEQKLAFFRGPHDNPCSPVGISKGTGIWGPISNSSHPDLLYQHQTVKDVNQVKACSRKGSAFASIKGAEKNPFSSNYHRS